MNEIQMFRGFADLAEVRLGILAIFEPTQILLKRKTVKE